MIEDVKESPIEHDDDFDFNLSDDLLSEDEHTLKEQNPHEEAIIADQKRKLSLFSRIPVQLTVEVASTEISLAELMSINSHSIIELDKMAGEPLDIKINGIFFGKAEVVAINDKYGVRIIELNNKELSELVL